MEYVEGETLRERLRRGPLPWQEAAAAVTCVLEALAHAHAADILHRDIKPENIMLTSKGVAKLLDFGLAKDVHAAPHVQQDPECWLTTAGSIVATAGYMAPEVLRGEPLDARCDVFSAGAVLYEAVVGSPVFPGKTTAERLASILEKELPPIESRTANDVRAHLLYPLVTTTIDRQTRLAVFRWAAGGSRPVPSKRPRAEFPYQRDWSMWPQEKQKLSRSLLGRLIKSSRCRISSRHR